MLCLVQRKVPCEFMQIFWILAQADALLGSCGSTFSSSASMISERPSGNLFVITGSDEAMRCASMTDQSLDLSGFTPENFASGANLDKCNCYAPQDPRGGTCIFQCSRQPRPSKCTDARHLGPDSEDAASEEVEWHQVKNFN